MTKSQQTIQFQRSDKYEQETDEEAKADGRTRDSRLYTAAESEQELLGESYDVDIQTGQR